MPLLPSVLMRQNIRRVHELGRMRLPALVALYLDMAGHEFRGQATRLGYVPGPARTGTG